MEALDEECSEVQSWKEQKRYGTEEPTNKMFIVSEGGVYVPGVFGLKYAVILGRL